MIHDVRTINRGYESWTQYNHSNPIKETVINFITVFARRRSDARDSNPSDMGAINLIPLKPTDIHSFSARRVHSPASGHNYTLAACLVDYTSYPSNLCVYFIIIRRCCLTRNRWEIFYEWTRLRFFLSSKWKVNNISSSRRNSSI